MARTKKTSPTLERAADAAGRPQLHRPEAEPRGRPGHQRLRCPNHLHASGPRYLQHPALAGGRGLQQLPR